MVRRHRVVVACNASSDATLVARLLEDVAAEIIVARVESGAADDFDTLRPEVLVLGFDTLEDAEQYCLGLHRRTTLAQASPHRAIVLCHKDVVRRAYELCKKGTFDDYVLFWPFNYDAPRLAMAVHNALRDMALASAAPKVVSEAYHAAHCQTALARRVSEGRRHFDSFSQSIGTANAEINAALDNLATDLAGVADGPAQRRRLLTAVHEVEATRVQPQLQRVADAIRPLAGWTADLESELVPALTSARRLQELAQRETALVLVVDDDEFQQRMVALFLEGEQVHTVCASSAAEMAAALRHQVPRLVLMDVNLPDVNGVEATRRLKSVERYADTSVVIMTGQSERRVVTDSIAAGAVDFVVKPIDKATLIEKVRRYTRLDWGPTRALTP